MSDHEIDTLVAAANPVEARALGALELAASELLLCEAIVGERAAADRPAAPRRRRLGLPRLPRLAAVVAVAVIAVVATVALVGRDPGPSGTAWAAPLVRLAESSPLLLLDVPGWSVTRADEYGDDGEMTFTDAARTASGPSDAGSADLHWRSGPIGLLKRDRAHDAPLVVQRTVLGERAQVSRYADSTHFTAIWPDGERALEFRATTTDLAQFEKLLAALRRVDVDTWLSAMPASVVKAASRGAVVREMLAGIPLPPGFDAAALERGPSVSDRYQVAANVTGRVACAWFDRWAAARRRGDAATERAAVEAMQTVRGWKVLAEIEREGGWSRVLWAYADAMRGDGTWHGRPLASEIQGGLGCGAR